MDNEWKQVHRVRSEGMRSLHDIMECDSPEELKSPEEFVAFIGQSVRLLKWKMLGVVHTLGRYQMLQHFISFTDDSETSEKIPSKIKQIHGLLSKIMKKEDNEIFQACIHCVEGLSAVSNVIHQQVEKVGAEVFNPENLDYHGVFKSCAMDMDPWTLSMFSEQSLAKGKFDALKSVLTRSFNNGKPLTPVDRADLEENIMEFFGYSPPGDFETARTEEVFGFMTYGAMSSKDSIEDLIQTAKEIAEDSPKEASEED